MPLASVSEIGKPLPAENMLENADGLLRSSLQDGVTTQPTSDPIDAAACCALLPLTRALLVTSLHSKAAPSTFNRI